MVVVRQNDPRVANASKPVRHSFNENKIQIILIQ